MRKQRPEQRKTRGKVMNKEKAFMHENGGLNKEKVTRQSYVSKKTRKRCRL